MPIAIAAPVKKVAWDDAETRRRADSELEHRLLDALGRARAYVDVTMWESGSDEQVLDNADVELTNVIDQLKERLSAPANLQRKDLLEICQLSVELVELGREHQERKLSRRLRGLSALQQALARPHGEASVDRMLERAAREVCRACGFDRAMIFRVDGPHLRAHTSYFRDHDAWAAEAHEVAEANPLSLESSRFETEMLRRRAAALVLDPMEDPRAWKHVVNKIETTGYVAVPIIPDGNNVIATLHCDTHFSGRRVDAIDRDAVSAFAVGLGSMLERKVLAERLVTQHEHVRSMLQSADELFSDFTNNELLDRPQRLPSAGRLEQRGPFEPQSRSEMLLSRREIEVLRLMAAGATNATIAEQLVISEGTVKSHVKRIFRKLRVANRAEAVSRFLRLEGGLQAAEETRQGLEST